MLDHIFHILCVFGRIENTMAIGDSTTRTITRASLKIMVATPTIKAIAPAPKTASMPSSPTVPMAALPPSRATERTPAENTGFFRLVNGK